MDDLFTFDNPGLWLGRRRWPTSVKGDDAFRWVFVLQAVDLIGRAAWGAHWLAPPFEQGDTVAIDRFMRTISRVRALCASGALNACYEDWSGSLDADVQLWTMYSREYDDWYTPGWERIFLLGVVPSKPNRWGYVSERPLYVDCELLQEYISSQQPPLALPAPPPERNRAGREPTHDWEEAELYLKERLWPERGDPATPQNKVDGWKSDTDVGKHVLAHMENCATNAAPPDLSTVMKKVRNWLGELRRN